VTGSFGARCGPFAVLSRAQRGGDRTRALRLGALVVAMQAQNRSNGDSPSRRRSTFSFTHICWKGRTGLLAPAHHHCEAAAGEAEAGEVSAHATPASAHPRAGTVVGERGARTSRLLNGRARQPSGRQRLPQRAQQALAACASAPQPAPSAELGADEPSHR